MSGVSLKIDPLVRGRVLKFTWNVTCILRSGWLICVRSVFGVGPAYTCWPCTSSHILKEYIIFNSNHGRI